MRAKHSRHLLAGALKPEGPLPTDAELKDAYTDHLVEKYR